MPESNSCIGAASRVAHSFFPRQRPNQNITNAIDEPWERAMCAAQLNAGFPGFLVANYPDLGWKPIANPMVFDPVVTKLDFACLLFAHLSQDGAAPRLPSAAERDALCKILEGGNL